MQFENISGAYIKKKGIEMCTTCSTKNEGIDDMVCVHAKFEMQQKYVQGDTKR